MAAKRKSARRNRPGAGESAAAPPGSRRSAVRRLFARAGLVLGSIVVALLLGEIALRVFKLQPERYPLPRWFAWDGTEYRERGIAGGGLIKRAGPYVNEGVTMGEYVPHAKFKVVYATNPRGYFDAHGGVPFQINSEGLRGPEVSVNKPADTFRILGLGDSFTMGYGVRDEDTFLRRLETSLNQQAPPRCEVLNAGVGGYNTRDEVLYLERRWLAFDPDLVLINFYLNDAYSDEAIINMGQELGLYFEPTGLAKSFYLADLVQHAYRTRDARRQLDEYYLGHYFSKPGEFLAQPGRKRIDWNVSRQALARAAQLAREHHFRLALVIFPELFRLNSGYPFAGVHELVLDTAKALEIPALDLTDTFRGRPERDLWVHPSDHHPNEIANQLAAVAIETFLRGKGLVPTGAATAPAKSSAQPGATPADR